MRTGRIVAGGMLAFMGLYAMVLYRWDALAAQPGSLSPMHSEAVGHPGPAATRHLPGQVLPDVTGSPALGRVRPAVSDGPFLLLDWHPPWLRIEGSVPDQDSRDLIAARARAVYHDAQVQLRLDLRAQPVPGWWGPLVWSFPPDLRRLDQASLSIQGGKASLQGVAASEAERQMLLNHVRLSLGDQVSLVEQLAEVPATEDGLVSGRSQQPITRPAGPRP